MVVFKLKCNRFKWSLFSILYPKNERFKIISNVSTKSLFTTFLGFYSIFCFGLFALLVMHGKCRCLVYSLWVLILHDFFEQEIVFFWFNHGKKEFFTPPPPPTQKEKGEMKFIMNKCTVRLQSSIDKQESSL